MRRLDRSRPFGQNFGDIGRRAFVQDGIDFDRDGYAVDDDPPIETDAAPQTDAPLTGGVFVSVPETDTHIAHVEFIPNEVKIVIAENGDAVRVATAPKIETTHDLAPLSRREWEVMDFRKLKKNIARAFGVEPNSMKTALKILRDKGLIKGA